MALLLLILPIAAAALIGRLWPSRQPARPIATWATMVAVGICLVAQLAWPVLLASFERYAGAIRAGEVYRLFTALWFQDGGAAGGVFNLAMLWVVGTAAERLWSRPVWAAFYLLGGLANELVGLWWQPIGAGNSVAYMALAGSVLAKGLLADRTPWIWTAATMGLAAALLLAFHEDIHGAAVLIGAALGCVALLVPQRMSRSTHAAVRR